MGRRGQSSRRRLNVDDGDDDVHSTASLTTLDTEAARAMNDLGNAARDRMTAHDRERDRYVNHVAIDRLRKCNLTGTEEAKSASQHQTQLSAWHSVLPVEGEPQPESIAAGQYHREKMSREVRLEVARLQEDGIEADAGNFDQTQPYQRRLPMLANAKGSAVATQSGRGRSFVKPTSLSIPGNRPLDPAVDPTRKYGYKGRGGAYTRERVDPILRSSKAVARPDNPFSDFSRHQKARAGAVRPPAREYRTVQALVNDPEEFIKRLGKGHGVSPGETSSSSKPNPPSKPEVKPQLRAVKDDQNHPSDEQNAPSPLESPDRFPKFPSEKRTYLGDPKEFVNAMKNAPRVLKSASPKGGGGIKHSDVNASDNDSNLVDRAKELKKQEVIDVRRAGLRPPEPSPILKGDKTDGRLTPVSMSSLSTSAIAKDLVQSMSDALSESQTERDTIDSANSHQTTSDKSLMDETPPLRVSTVVSLQPEKVLSPKMIGGQWYLPAPKGFNPDDLPAKVTKVYGENQNFSGSGGNPIKSKHNDSPEIHRGVGAKNPFQNPNHRRLEATGNRLLTIDEQMVLATRGGHGWVRPQKLSDLTEEQKAIICPEAAHKRPEDTHITAKPEPLKTADKNSPLRSRVKLVQSKWADESAISEVKALHSARPIVSFLQGRATTHDEAIGKNETSQEYQWRHERTGSRIRYTDAPALQPGGCLFDSLTKTAQSDKIERKEGTSASTTPSFQPSVAERSITTPTVKSSQPTGGLKFLFSHRHKPSDSDSSEL